MTRYAASTLSRRHFLKAASVFALLQPTNAAWADAFVNLELPGGPDQRSITTAPPEGSDGPATEPAAIARDTV
jgi:hypothetical protein